MSNLAEYRQQADQLLAVYHQQSSEVRAILRVLSIIYQKVNQTTLNRLLESLFMHGALGEVTEKPKLVKDMRENLTGLGLIDAKSSGLQPPSVLCHDLTQLAGQSDNLELMFRLVEVELPLSPSHHYQFVSPMQRERQLRKAMYLGQFDTLIKLLNEKKPKLSGEFNLQKVLETLLFAPYDPAFFGGLPAAVQSRAIDGVLAQKLYHGQPFQSWLGMLEQVSQDHPQDEALTYISTRMAMEQLQLGKAQILLADLPESAEALALAGWHEVITGDVDKALELYDTALAQMRKKSRRKTLYVQGMSGVYYVLAMAKKAREGNMERLNQAQQTVDNAMQDGNKPALLEFVYHCLSGLLARLRQSGASNELMRLSAFYRERLSPRVVHTFAYSALVHQWCGEALPEDYPEILRECFDYVVAAEQFHCALLCAQAMTHDGCDTQDSRAFLAEYGKGVVNMSLWLEPKEAWIEALDKLDGLGVMLSPENRTEPEQPETSDRRMVWWIYPAYSGHRLEPREQKLGKKGWTKGRVVALQRLFEHDGSLDYLTPEDNSIIRAIHKSVDYNSYSYQWGAKDTYSLEGYGALRAATGHPALYFADRPSESVALEEAEPVVQISKNRKGYHVAMLSDEQSLFRGNIEGSLYELKDIGPGYYQLIHYSEQDCLVAAVLGEKGLHVPEVGKERLIKSIRSIAPHFNIQSDVSGIGEAVSDVEQQPADTRLHVLIQPHGSGLEMTCRVQPLGEGGPMVMPGQGNTVISTRVDGKLVGTTRDLEAEWALFDKLREQCHWFGFHEHGLLQLDDLQDALGCLLALEQIQSSDNAPELLLQWPKGQNVSLTKPVDSSQMQVKLSQQQDWFSLDGELQIDEEQVMALKDILPLLEASPGRFVELDKDKFLVLTEQLQRKLADLAASTLDGQFHPLAAPLVDDALQGMKVKANKAWKNQVGKLQQALDLQPKLPGTLQAELRDYQQQGFDWAVRLSHWGAGACLADDMGLGKTLQALAVILSRSFNGPTLVLAPTSVCFNWQSESLRFAPTLMPKLLGLASPKERNAMLKNAGAFDLIICSYGLLATLGDKLKAVDWHTIVADEAQALKNPAAKRTKQAYELKGDFKMITTGTPIENNLTELWSLFRFINPGLLDSREQFNDRFGGPIENVDREPEKARHAKDALRRLIQPFMMRRLKSEVLTELPSRTEINLHVQLSEQERVLYEALRQTAVENMLESDDNAAQKRIKVLAEIMKLRRACCHPSLVVEDSHIAGSKLAVFDELVDELRQGNHKALVFSQFVGHLSILREHLDKKGVGFQYLDGSTPARQRQKAVNAFQAGEGDLFLISLKAGGAGLNLTAADYVIHMDPWWNPAVEDQASDRAHRLGQTRPVTIYRLISQHTIEDKIVALHQRKRDLAESLLEGSDGGGTLSFEDMMNLLKQ